MSAPEIAAILVNYNAGAELAREIEKLGDVGARGHDVLEVGIDKPAAVAACDRGHRYLLADRGTSLVERRTLRELQRVETRVARGLVLLLRG